MINIAAQAPQTLGITPAQRAQAPQTLGKHPAFKGAPKPFPLALRRELREAMDALADPKYVQKLFIKRAPAPVKDFLKNCTDFPDFCRKALFNAPFRTEVLRRLHAEDAAFRQTNPVRALFMRKSVFNNPHNMRIDVLKGTFPFLSAKKTGHNLAVGHKIKPQEFSDVLLKPKSALPDALNPDINPKSLSEVKLKVMYSKLSDECKALSKEPQFRTMILYTPKLQAEIINSFKDRIIRKLRAKTDYDTLKMLVQTINNPKEAAAKAKELIKTGESRLYRFNPARKNTP